MIKWIFWSALLLTSFTPIADIAPDEIEISGKFDLVMSDGENKTILGRFLKSTADLTSANSCTLNIIADDDYFNSYPGAIELMRLSDDSVIPIFRIMSKYLDENGRYWNKGVVEAIAMVSDTTTQNWPKDKIKGQLVLLDTNNNSGLEMFHHLTLGQPMQIALERQESPVRVKINISPLTGKSALLARKCLKLVHDGT